MPKPIALRIGSIVTRRWTGLRYIRYFVFQDGKDIPKQEPTGSSDLDVAQRLLARRIAEQYPQNFKFDFRILRWYGKTTALTSTFGILSSQVGS
jgi:hypothetical protein